MAIGKCGECKGKVSTNAAVCPHCGAPVDQGDVETRAKRDKRTGCSAIILIGILLLIWFAVSTDPTDSSGDSAKKQTATESNDGWKTRDNSTMAYIMMEDFVKARLKAPSTAKFQSIWDGRGDAVTRLPDHAYRIRSYVDAQNGFGAQIRNRFRGEIKQTSDRGWHLQSLTIDN